MNIEFEWDAQNAIDHFKKHKVSFELAACTPWLKLTAVQKLFASLVPERLINRKGNAMKTTSADTARAASPVQFQLNTAEPAPLSPSQKQELATLAAIPDSAIDHSDIPAQGDAFWQHARRNPFYKATKQSTTVRVDSDVLYWLKSSGKGYQTRINTILRHAMLRELA